MASTAGQVESALWNRAPCLGCGSEVRTRRDPYVVFNGLRDGSLLVLTHVEPGKYAATRPVVPANLMLYRLGIAHRGCIERARQRLEAREIRLPEALPVVDPAILQESPIRLDLPPSADRCPFCEDCTDLSDEDALPLWVSRALVKRHGKLKLPTPYGPRDKAYLRFRVPIGEVCNNEWLSVLENDVKSVMEPMIFGPARGEPPCRILTAADQQLLGTWAVKTALMFDLGMRPQAIPRFFYEQLELYRRALPNTVVFLGANSGDTRAVRIAHGGLKLGTTPGLAYDAFMTVITVFRVVFKVMGFLGPAFPQTLHYPPGYMDTLHRIWPLPGGDIEWPRGGMAFDDHSLITFENELPWLDDVAA